jgi:DNA-3-methyladenine glycosylase I
MTDSSLAPQPSRCAWCLGNDLYVAYHDHEWGVPLHDDRRIFELLALEGAQAGLSWLTILKKREAYRRAFDGFDPHTGARYTEKKIAALLRDEGIVRNRLKINAAVTNARAFLEVQAAFGSFDAYVWRFTDGRTLVNAWKTIREIPALTPESMALSKDLVQRGFKFVGPTICYAHMQSMGMVDDHVVDCFRHGRM